ncbi:MAG: CHAT domain-containing protein [bacterium]
MEKLFVLHIRCAKDLLSLSAQEQFLNERKTIEYYEDLEVSHTDINNNCIELFRHLNSTGKKAKADNAVIDRIKYIGQSLFDQLLTLKIKKLLYSTRCKEIILKIDGNLVQIPWELLYDGSQFLCQKFSIGRVVTTKQTIAPLVIRKPEKPLKLLVLADSKGDLEASYEEGKILVERFRNLYEQIEINLKTTFIKTEFIKKSLREFDIIHFAGHAKYDLQGPSSGGWQTADGMLTTADVINMIGGAPLPFLIFSNACQSSQTEPWSFTADGKKGAYGLANAFLLAGVQHYIGTFWDIPDRPGLHFAEEFYQNLLKGISIGQSLRKARLHLIQRYGEENTTWMAYMLYGDPTCIYFGKDAFSKNGKEEYFEERRYNQEFATLSEGHAPETVAQDPHRETRGERSQALRKTVSSRRFPSWLTHPLNIVLFICLFVMILVGTVSVLKRLIHKPSSTPHTAIPAKNDQDSIDSLIKDIENRLKERGKGRLSDFQDGWTSRPMTMACFGHLSVSDIDSREHRELQRLNDLLTREITSAIQNQGSIPLVDRKHLDNILMEHRISLSDFADKKQDLILLARFLGARFIMFSEILPYKKQYKIDINLIETETSLIRVAFTYPMEEEKQCEAVAANIAKRVIREMGSLYPLRGKITAIDDPDKVELNIGSRVGMRPGLIMAILGKKDEPAEIGQIKVITAEHDFSLAKVLDTKRSLENGDRVITNEIWPQTGKF